VIANVINSHLSSCIVVTRDSSEASVGVVPTLPVFETVTKVYELTADFVPTITIQPETLGAHDRMILQTTA